MVNWLRNRFGYRDSAADTVTWHVLAPSSLTSLYPIPIPTRLPACLFQLLGVLAQSACVNGKTFNVSGHVINPNLCSVLCTLSLPFYDLICNLLRGLLRPVFVDLFFSFRLPFSFSCLFFLAVSWVDVVIFDNDTWGHMLPAEAWKSRRNMFRRHFDYGE